jgi:transcriptional accessory protein Tex/SPT6
VPKHAKGKKASAKAPDPARAQSQKKRRVAPPPAVNEPLSFINFVAAFTVGNTVDGEVVSFTSHGAMVDVTLPDGGVLHCYIPLTAMGTPPPTKARQVLTKGEVRPFVLAGLDPPRRVAELSLPVSAHAAPARAATPAKKAPAAKVAGGTGAAKKSAASAKKAAKKQPAAKKAAAKASAKKAPVKKKAPAPAKKAGGAGSAAKAKKAPKARST